MSRGRRAIALAALLTLGSTGHVVSAQPKPGPVDVQSADAGTAVGQPTVETAGKPEAAMTKPGAEGAGGPPPDRSAELEEPEDRPGTEGPRVSLWMAGLFVVFFVLLIAVQRLRGRPVTSRTARRFLGTSTALLRFVLVLTLVVFVLQLIPADSDAVWWGALVVLVIIGWSVRDLFADVIAGLILTGEQRMRKGTWVSGDGFQGTVQGRSFRAVWLRDGEGHRLTVPNRAMVGAPVVYHAAGEAEHEVVVRLEGYSDASKVRQALNDAVLGSPWVLAGATPVVLRDPADPVVWRVRSRLLEPRFSVQFGGELLERVEDLLRYQPPMEIESRETVPQETLHDARDEG